MPAKRVALFATCLADIFMPEVPESVVRLLRRAGVQVEFPGGQTCCGQPAYNSGFAPEARRLADNFVRVFESYEYVISPSGSCASTVRLYYPELYAADPRRQEQVKALAGRVYEFSEFFVGVLGLEDVGARMKGRATYHPPCHMSRELGIVSQPRRMLRAVQGLELVEMERADLCCGFGGSFAVRMPEISVAIGDEKLEHVAATAADYLVSCDGGCLMHMNGRLQRLGRPAPRPVHLAQLLWEGVSGR